MFTKFASYKVPPVMVSTHGSVVPLAMFSSIFISQSDISKVAKKSSTRSSIIYSFNQVAALALVENLAARWVGIFTRSLQGFNQSRVSDWPESHHGSSVSINCVFSSIKEISARCANKIGWIDFLRVSRKDICTLGDATCIVILLGISLLSSSVSIGLVSSSIRVTSAMSSNRSSTGLQLGLN